MSLSHTHTQIRCVSVLYTKLLHSLYDMKRGLPQSLFNARVYPVARDLALLYREKERF